MRSQQTECGSFFQYNHRSHFGSRYHIVACYSQSVLPHGFDSRSRTFCVLLTQGINWLTQGINWLDAADIPACTSGNSGMQRRKFRHASDLPPALEQGFSSICSTMVKAQSESHKSRDAGRISWHAGEREICPVTIIYSSTCVNTR